MNTTHRASSPRFCNRTRSPAIATNCSQSTLQTVNRQTDLTVVVHLIHAPLPYSCICAMIGSYHTEKCRNMSTARFPSCQAERGRSHLLRYFQPKPFRNCNCPTHTSVIPSTMVHVHSIVHILIHSKSLIMLFRWTCQRPMLEAQHNRCTEFRERHCISVPAPHHIGQVIDYFKLHCIDANPLHEPSPLRVSASTLPQENSPL